MALLRKIQLCTLTSCLLLKLAAQAKERELEVVEIDVESDTSIMNGDYADRNFSEALALETIHNDRLLSEVLLRFKVPQESITPDSAFVWIRTTAEGTTPVQNAAYLVPDDRWHAETVTWNTKPKFTDELDAWVTDNDHTIKIDVTEQVAAASKCDGWLSIAIRAPHNVGDEGRTIYHSRETTGALSSKLVVRYHEPKTYVHPGESIQQAIDSLRSNEEGQVILSRGAHLIRKSLTIHSGITLQGQGIKHTAIKMHPEVNEPIIISSREGSVTRDVTLRDLTLDGQQKPSDQNYPGDTPRSEIRGDSFGIHFTDQQSGNKFERIRLRRVMITRCAMGIHVKGVNDLRIQDSEIRGNGCLIGFDHNIYFRRARNSLLKNLNISDCTAGNGFNLSTNCFNLIIDSCDASNNHFRGIRFEANDGGGRLMILNSTANQNGLKEKQSGIRVANVTDFVILNSTANGNGDYGIYCIGSHDGLIAGNTTRSNRTANIHLRNSRSVKTLANQ